MLDCAWKIKQWLLLSGGSLASCLSLNSPVMRMSVCLLQPREFGRVHMRRRVFMPPRVNLWWPSLGSVLFGIDNSLGLTIVVCLALFAFLYIDTTQNNVINISYFFTPDRPNLREPFHKTHDLWIRIFGHSIFLRIIEFWEDIGYCKQIQSLGFRHRPYGFHCLREFRSLFFVRV